MTDQITLAGGCFWCTESVFIRLPGVLKSVSGYANGNKAHPTYQEVCTGSTGHAEVVQVTYDTAATNLATLLDLFFKAHDPTTLNRQGGDTGTQYRSGIYFTNDEQKTEAEGAIKRAQKTWSQPIVTEVVSLNSFFAAEDYHQDYFVNHPNQGYCAFVVGPKVEKFQKTFAARVKS